MMKIFLILLLLIVLCPLLLILEKRYAKTHAEQIDHKKRNAVLAVLRGILLLFLTAAGFLIYKTEYEPKEIGVYDREPYRLVIYHVGEPGFPFGTSDCRLVLSRDGRRTGSMDITLHNDGKNPDTENFIVEWREDLVCVTVRGEEQEDTLCTLYFDGEGMRPLDTPQEFRANLIRWEKDGLRVQICDPMDNTVFPDGAQAEPALDLRALLRRLGDEGAMHVLCEGGAALASSLVSESLFDELDLFVAPLVLGAGARRTFGAVPFDLPSAPRLRASPVASRSAAAFAPSTAAS